MNNLRVGISPWAHMKPKCFPSRKTGCDPGVELNILDTIATMANLQISLLFTNEAGCGIAPDQGSNGTWTGLVKMLHSDEIDVTGNLCNVNNFGNNQTLLSSSWPVWQYQEQFLIQAPTSPPFTFAPFAPFSCFVWIAYAAVSVLCLGSVVLGYFIHNDFVGKNNVLDHIYRFAATLNGTNPKLPKISVRIFAFLWLILVGSVFIFYNTYILSAVLHPLPILRPFLDANGYVDALMSDRYRVLSFKNPPGAPVSCVGTCQQRFNDAIKKHGFTPGSDVLSVIAEQTAESESDPKLVYCDGMPFISLSFEDYPRGRDRFWLIDAGAQKWSSYLWKKNFKHADKLNKYLRIIGDYKSHALSKYVRPYGPQPHSGDRISGKGHEQNISLSHFGGLFLMHFGGMITAALVFLMEIAYANRHKCKIAMRQGTP